MKQMYDIQHRYCRRCGEVWNLCPHPEGCLDTSNEIDTPHAFRIRARHGLGRQFNPDHDTTSYMDRNEDVQTIAG